MSTLKTNTIDTTTGTTITIPTGKVLTVTDNSGISIAGTAVSSTATELNVLDGIPATLTATELGYVDGVTSALQTQINAKGDASLGTVQTFTAGQRGEVTALTSALQITINLADWTAGQRGEITALTSAASVTIDMADSNHFSCTMAHNITFANPSNLTAGQTGSIFLTQDGTGSRTASWGSYWDWAAGTAPTLTTTAAAVDRIDYVVRSATSINAVATLNLS